ncbi:MAG TPA: cellulase family glycosylhydrolase [Thermodesulfobacteriota bacterium]
MKKIFVVLLAFLFTAVVPALAELPPYWPWKGVAMTSLSAKPSDVALVKERLDLNSVRITLDVRLYAERMGLSPEVALEDNIRWASSMLDACRGAGVTGIISMSQFPINPSKGLMQESPEFWNNQAELAEVVRIAGVLAGAFKGRGAELGGYEFLNEPLVRSAAGAAVPPQWPALMKDTIAEIRRHDTERWIVVTPGAGGMPSGYKNFTPFDDGRIVYGAHMYAPFAFTHQGIREYKLGYAYPGRIYLKFWNRKALSNYMSDLIGFRNKYGVPVWIGEFSAIRWAPGAEKYLLDLAAEFNAQGWGWSYFSFGEYHGWNPDYGTGFSTDRREDWQAHFVGEGSLRWSTLKKMFTP